MTHNEKPLSLERIVEKAARYDRGAPKEYHNTPSYDATIVIGILAYVGKSLLLNNWGIIHRARDYIPIIIGAGVGYILDYYSEKAYAKRRYEDWVEEHALMNKAGWYPHEKVILPTQPSTPFCPSFCLEGESDEPDSYSYDSIKYQEWLQSLSEYEYSLPEFRAKYEAWEIECARIKEEHLQPRREHIRSHLQSHPDILQELQRYYDPNKKKPIIWF